MQTELLPTVKGGADLSECGLYRYRLWRDWSGDGFRMVFVMLNPSTADASVDDPTIRRCIGFAKRFGYVGIEVINLYALRATKPAHLLDHPDAEGPENRRYWDMVLRPYRPVIAAWGSSAADPRLPISYAAAAHDGKMDRWYCLGKTKDGYPRHPLYVRADAAVVPYRGQEVPNE